MSSSALLLQARTLSEAAHFESERANRSKEARRLRDWRKNQKEEAKALIGKLGPEILEAARCGEKFILVMYLEREDGSFEEGALGNDVNELRGSAQIVKNWAKNEGFEVSVQFQPGPANDGSFHLCISW